MQDGKIQVGRRTFMKESLSLAALGLSGWASAAGPRRQGEGEESFDASSIPAYEGRHDEVYRYLEAHQGEHLEKLRRWVRQPSISAQDRGIREMAEMVAGDLKELGFQEVELVPTSGHPGVWGYYDAGAAKTLMVYLMYDVQPVEPEDWRVDPFAGELVETELGEVLMARGATNQKGPERAFLNAVEAILAAHGSLPVNLMITAEGEEELGSPHYPEIVDRYENRLRQAGGVLFPFNSQGRDGRASLFLGVKGIVYFEMEARGGAKGGPRKAEIHGSLKALIDSPVWRLVQALASLTSQDGNQILVPGYQDPIRPPSREELRLLNGLLRDWNEEAYRKEFDVERFIGRARGREALRRLLFETTLNIDGIWAGYTGPGSKTILPHVATAKVDSRLVPDQTPEQALELIRRHLDAQGFEDVKIRKLSGYPPSQTSVEAPLIQAAIGVLNKYGRPPAVWPRLAGSAPFYQFTQRLGLPLAPVGLGHGSGAHAPDEYMVIRPKEGSPIASLVEIEKGYADLIFALAQVLQPR